MLIHILIKDKIPFNKSYIIKILLLIDRKNFLIKRVVLLRYFEKILGILRIFGFNLFANNIVKDSPNDIGIELCQARRDFLMGSVPI